MFLADIPDRATKMAPKSVSLRKLSRIVSKHSKKPNRGLCSLCDNCSKIRIKLDQGQIGDDIVFLGALKTLASRQNCMLCSVISQTVASSVGEGHTNVADWHAQCILNPRYGDGEMFALFCGDVAATAVRAWIRIEIPPGTLDGILDKPSAIHDLNMSALFKRAKQTCTLDTQKIRSWLHECESTHGVKCDGHELQTGNNKAENLLLIDVIENKLVHETQVSRYVALSYVWGDWGGATITQNSWATPTLLQKKDALLNPNVRLPNVLRDAIALVRDVGIRYLWCDALCIFQDNMSQKSQQVKQMDVIYSHALFTIIALTGKHGDQLIPGVLPGSRKPIYSIAGADHCLKFISRAPELDILRLVSTYESRAWTFQERLLSRRCLFITDRQAYFQCALKSYREDEDLTGSHARELDERVLCSQPSGLTALLKNDNPFGLYAGLIRDYTSRNLTNKWDILNAFDGISNVLQNVMDTEFVEGLPSTYLDEALLWSPQSRIQLRGYSINQDDSNHHIPTWSWAAWCGRVQYRLPQLDEYTVRDMVPYQIQTAVPPFFVITKDGLTKSILRRHDRSFHQCEEDHLGIGYEHFLMDFVQFGFNLIRCMESNLVQHIHQLEQHTCGQLLERLLEDDQKRLRRLLYDDRSSSRFIEVDPECLRRLLDDNRFSSRLTQVDLECLRRLLDDRWSSRFIEVDLEYLRILLDEDSPLQRLLYEDSSLRRALEEDRQLYRRLLSDIDDIFLGHSHIINVAPFHRLPSATEFVQAAERRRNSYTSRHTSSSIIISELSNLAFWPFSTLDIQSRQPASDASSSPVSTLSCVCRGRQWDLPTWPLFRTPSLQTLRTGLPGHFYSVRSINCLHFWTYTLTIDASHFRGGQLFRNAFSMSSRYTTRDGTRQCDVVTLGFSADGGIVPGQEQQPATLMCNALGEMCGVVLEEEDDCLARMVGRSCYLVLLSRSVSAEDEAWHNFMIVAESGQDYFERVAIVRVVPMLLKAMDSQQKLRYVRLL